ncbi:MAG: VWA domain-containing protein [Bacteroidales bacterium]|nr:VWA domain-containing protein [Bacteroidales bacterium]MBS3776260.1 VWA domain-containing protein [Bacteroidales bacterium]
MFKFGNSEFLYGLIIIPVLIVIFLIGRYGKKRALKKFGDWGVISHLMPFVSSFRPVLKFIFLILALTSVIFALANPQFGSRLEKVKREGVEVMIALDVSNSMLAEDIEPNRLERAKRAISKMVDQLSNDKIGLIVFAGDAYVQVPLTTDYSAVKMYLSAINTDIVPRQGTAIGSAVELAIRSFDEESEMDKALIIITDGENHEGDVMKVTREAEEKGITVHAIGMGDPSGSPIPLREENGATVYQKDQQGNAVVSKLNEETLEKIAAQGNGIYIHASNARTGLNELFEEISKMNQQEIESKVYTDYQSRFQYLIAIALIFLFADLLVLERKNQRFMKFNLFKIRK